MNLKGREISSAKVIFLENRIIQSESLLTRARVSDMNRTLLVIT